MKSSQILRGGKWWGTPQIEQVGFYEYGVSPFHLKPFKGFFQPGIYKSALKFGKLSLFILPPGLFYYYLAKWADNKYEYYCRKEYLNSPEGQAAKN